MDSNGRIAFWIVLALAGALLLVRTQAVPLIDPDEARFARTSVEMMRTGNLVVPTYEWTPRLVKPPFLHWIQVSLFRALGVSETVARLPSLLATLGSILILGWVARRRFGDEGAFWMAAIFITMPLVVATGRIGGLDALLAVHVLAAVALDLAEPKEAGAYRIGAIGGLLGIAFLIKGPVGVLLPLIVILAGRTAAGRNLLPARGPLLAFIGIWCVVVLPWGVAFIQHVGAADVLETLRAETLDRYFAGTDHVRDSFYYPKVLLIGLVPWVAPLGTALVRLIGQRRDPAARTALYAAAGMLAGLLFFALGRGKLASYLLPLAPLAAILVTWELGQELKDRDRTLGPTLLAASLAAFGLVLLIASGRYPESPIPEVALAGALIYLSGGAIAFLGVLRRRPRWVFGSAALTAFSFLFVIVTVLQPAIADGRSARTLIDKVPAVASTRPLVVVEMHVPSLIFYLDRVPERVTASRLDERLARGDDPLFVVDPDDLALIGEGVASRWREVGRHGKYRVYETVGESKTMNVPALLDDAGTPR